MSCRLIALLATEWPAPLVWMVVVWLFTVGACIGSFMNVVVYRLPAGLSLLHPPSRCPMCETPIRASDNVPIFGWLWLRGRCRRCGAKFSARYPAVELLVAVVFVALACAEPLARGHNLPVASESRLTQNELWSIYAYHLFLLCSLICAAFTEFDGHPLTRRLTVPGFVLGLAAPSVWPRLRPTGTLLADLPWMAALVDGLVGGVTGAALGYTFGLATRIWRSKSGSSPDVWPQAFANALAWVGVFLGWQAALGLASAAIATHLLSTVIARFLPGVGRVGLVGCVTPWTFVWIVAWRTIAEVAGGL